MCKGWREWDKGTAEEEESRPINDLYVIKGTDSGGVTKVLRK